MPLALFELLVRDLRKILDKSKYIEIVGIVLELEPQSVDCREAHSGS